MAHRYWRVRVYRCHSTILIATEIELRSTFGGADETGSGTPSASSTTGGSAAGAFANDGATTFWQAAGSVTAMDTWIAYDFGLGNDKDIVEVAWTIATAARNPADAALEYSDDGVAWTEYGRVTASSAAANATTLYSYPPLNAEIVEKAGFHVVQATWANNEVTTQKEGFQVVVGVPPDPIVEKTGFMVPVGPTDGAKIAVANHYAVFERAESARVASVNAYVIFRPIPAPPRKTVLIQARGTGFGGSGIKNSLKGHIVQTQSVLGGFQQIHNMKGSLLQTNAVEADLYVDQEIEDVWLEGMLEQATNFSASFYMPQPLAGVVDQESTIVADLYVDQEIEDVWLEGELIQLQDVEGAMVIRRHLAGSMVQTNLAEADLDVAPFTAAWSFQIDIPAQADVLTDFPVLLDLSHLPGVFWEKYTPNSLRIFKADGTTPLPFDLVSIDTTLRTGLAFFKADTLSNTVTTSFILKVLGMAITPVLVTDTYGRNAVWSDYEVMLTMNSLVNRNGSGKDAVVVGTTADDPDRPGWLKLVGTGYWRVPGISTFTQWTMGVSWLTTITNASRGILSYSDNITADSSRETIAIQSTGTSGLWNNVDTWQGATAIAANVRYRSHGRHNGTTNRTYNRIGVANSIDTTVVQRPGAGSDMSLFIGESDLSGDQGLNGSINFAYLRNGLISDAWIYAEQQSWESPGSFYTITTLGSEPSYLRG